MKYNIIVSMFAFLFLTACNPDFNTNQKDIKYHSSKKRLKSNKKGPNPKTKANQNQEADQNQEVDPNKRTKNALLDDLRNLIEKANADREKYVKKLKEESPDQYGILAFKELGWGEGPGEKISDNTERSIRYRTRTYGALNDIDTDKLKEFTRIIMLSKQTQDLFNTLSAFGGNIDDVIVYLYPKKDNLDKLEISDLEKLKDLFKKLLSTKEIVSKISKQLLLDYQDDTNSIKTDTTKLELHGKEIVKQIVEQKQEAEKLRNDILLINNF
ncbi:virulence associated lipoprotein [Borreliella garinii]|uniref:virulence associated lipoprotein n=2 Tax=Borreliella garinii TaxID=29519 RepID=UPI0004044030|nr:virulence associated lipoprotein [Borreliella garinii]